MHRSLLFCSRALICPRVVPVSRLFSSAAPKQVDMKLVKALRELTGAPMGDCKNAIVNSQNESDVLTAAQNWLRKLGKTQQTKKAGRETKQGLIGLFVEGTKGVLVELNCETDFVAQNTKFHNLLRDITLVAGKTKGGVDAKSILGLDSALLGKGTLADHVSDALNALRENIQLTRLAVLQGEHAMGSYMHQSAGEQQGPVRLGKIGCLVAARSSAPSVHSNMGNVVNTIAMHSAAACPRYLNQAAIPADALQAETALLREQAVLSGKGNAHIDNIVAGRLKKFYEEACLLNQKLMVTEAQEPVETFAKENNTIITGFLRFQVGEAL